MSLISEVCATVICGNKIVVNQLTSNLITSENIIVSDDALVEGNLITAGDALVEGNLYVAGQFVVPTVPLASNLANGSLGAIPYQLAPNNTTFLPVGTNSQVLSISGGLPSYVDQSTLSVGNATNATTSTNLASGAAGSLPFQSASNSTTFLPIGTNSQVLSIASGLPSYVNQSSLSVGSATSSTNATNATTSTNLASGAAGSLPYQLASNSTTFLSIGTNSQVLSIASGLPSYVDQSTLSVGNATNATTSTNLALGAAGSLPYQSASNSTTFLPVGTNSQVLSIASGLPSYVNQSSLSVGSATNATTSTNLASGAAGSLPYQSAPNSTTFLPIGTNSQVLSIASGLPSYVNQSTLIVGRATNIAGGVAGSLPYQSAANTTAFLAIGSSGQVLTISGGVPTWSNSSTIAFPLNIFSLGGSSSNSTNLSLTAAGSTNVFTNILSNPLMLDPPPYVHNQPAGSGFTLDTANNRYNCNTTGSYVIRMNMNCSSVAAGPDFFSYLRINGSLVNGSGGNHCQTRSTFGNPWGQVHTFQVNRSFVAGDYFDIIFRSINNPYTVTILNGSSISVQRIE